MVLLLLLLLLFKCSNLGQKIKFKHHNKKKKNGFSETADHRVKLKESEKPGNWKNGVA